MRLDMGENELVWEVELYEHMIRGLQIYLRPCGQSGPQLRAGSGNSV